MTIFLNAIEVILSIAIIVIVLMQPSKADGLKGLIQGNSETFFSRNKGRTRESRLAKMTIVFSVLFAIVTIILNLLNK
ncbi:preprotein translocase subunit SecG [Clostridium sp. 19966]|uniref:preprotein translocase subunit SecG n=1 Tax=Clostridium sp. 19966 TaxID=2768166 RepID=UPI0028E02400|nr:preprotein translocase subunit SecG [Clostridium sp. 19966]MDT8717890.1 preprotein translocase subunit SecG [Clostridium sp. 19966]